VRNTEEKKLEDLGLWGIILKWKLEIGRKGVDWSNLAEERNIWKVVLKASRNLGF